MYRTGFVQFQPVRGKCVEWVEDDAGKADDKHITANNDLFGDRRPEYAPDRQAD